MDNTLSLVWLRALTSDVYTRSLFSVVALLLLCMLSSGCAPAAENLPPTDAEIFTSPIAGANLGPGPSGVILNTALTDAPQTLQSASGLPGICYTIDGSVPNYIDYNGAVVCAGASTYSYVNAAWVRCDGAEESVERTLTILYLWDNGVDITEQISSAQYSLDCVPPPAGAVQFSVAGSGSVALNGEEIGTVDILSGFGQFDPTTATLTYSIVAKVNSDIGIVGLSTNNTVQGVWTWSDEPGGIGQLSGVSIESAFGSCQPLGYDPFTLCNFSDLLNGPMTLNTDPIVFDLNSGGTTSFQTEAEAVLGLLGSAANVTNITITALP